MATKRGLCTSVTPKTASVDFDSLVVELCLTATLIHSDSESQIASEFPKNKLIELNTKQQITEMTE